MEIIQKRNNDELVIALQGELNTATAPELESVITNSLNGVKKLVFDFSELDYISSAGLRILLVSKKVMDKQGEMIIRHPNNSVMEILEITGFKSILTIE